MSRPAAAPLPSEETSRLTDFARACKAAARVVALYPATHPAIQSSLTRAADSAARLLGRGEARLTVLPDGLLLNDRVPGRGDSAVQELAAMLHGHLIGEMTLVADMAPAAWHTFLGLIARSPEDIRGQGGIVQAWMAAGGGPIELRQIDYGDVLREREGALVSDWDEIVANYLEGEFSDLDDEAMAALLEISGDTSRFREFAERLVAQADESGEQGKKDLVLLIFQALADYVARTQPEQLDRVLSQIAGVIPRMTPDMVVTLITTGAPVTDAGAAGIDLAGEMRNRLTDQNVAEFIAQSVSRDQGATNRLAQAFQALVPEAGQRSALLEMAEAAAESMPIGRQADFSDLWKNAANLLTSYSDTDWVSDEYGRELATARTHAIEVERVSDDPPERISSWLSTVSEHEVRRLDQQVLLDLLVIETRPDAWQRVLESAVTSIEQLVHTGSLSIAHPLLDAVTAAGNTGGPFADAARAGLTHLQSGSVMKHVMLVIRQSRDDEVPTISSFCRALGPTAIKPLAEALAFEQGGAVKRFRDVLLSFGAAARDYVDDLRRSANPTARRTAVELLRSFGGAEALPQLEPLLADAEPAIQRDALRAILQIGTDEAYATLAEAIKTSEAQRRSAIMQVLSSSHDERAAPLFVYILDHTNHRGAFESVYVLAVESLGHLGGGPNAVDALKKVLYRGEWWAPGRTRRLRAAAATALRACGSPASQQALEAAAQDGPGGVRRAAKRALEAPAPASRAPRKAS
jgi:hypothetical protein